MALYIKKRIKILTRSRCIFTVTLLLAIAIILLVLSFHAFFQDSTSSSLDENIFLPCETIQDSANRYNCYKDSALFSLQKDEEVEQLSKYALEFAHNRSHLMGHAIARATLIVSDYNLDSTAKKCLPNCITGYWHGIAEEWGKYAPLRVEEYVDFFSKLCNSDQGKRVDCTGHSTGHLYMSVHKNLDENLTLCDNLESNSIFSECTMGVMHQYRIDGGAKDIFELCESRIGRVKKACYETLSFLYSRWEDNANTTNRLESCKELNPRIPVEFNRCYDGIGAWLSGKGGAPPLEICDSLNSSFTQLCRKGLSSPSPFVSSLGCGGEPTTACGDL